MPILFSTSWSAFARHAALVLANFFTSANIGPVSSIQRQAQVSYFQIFASGVVHQQGASMPLVIDQLQLWTIGFK